MQYYLRLCFYHANVCYELGNYGSLIPTILLSAHI